jgi:hypothetical protein
VQDSYPMSWKDLYLQALLESAKENLTELVHAVEQAMGLRALSDCAIQEEERSGDGSCEGEFAFDHGAKAWLAINVIAWRRPNFRRPIVLQRARSASSRLPTWRTRRFCGLRGRTHGHDMRYCGPVSHQEPYTWLAATSIARLATSNTRPG